MFWPYADQIITHRSLYYVNVYRQHDVVPAAAASPAAEAAVKRIVDHAHFLASEPAEAKLLLDFWRMFIRTPANGCDGLFCCLAFRATANRFGWQ
jgi:hypothetical protein